MKKVYFTMVLHFHQPIGNFESVFERASQLCYRPFLEKLAEFPDIKMAFHISGCLLDYFDEKEPDMIRLIKGMVLRGQIEMLGGGYYEPILPSIPERDTKGQISMMSEYIKERFGTMPEGMWIPERVWEPQLAKPIYEAGIRYSILDDAHLLRSGIKKEDMHGYFLAQKGSKKIAIFPSDKTLRYNLPYKPPCETLNYFRQQAKEDREILFVYGDDGEKFGEWPGTYDWVYKENWLGNFFDTLKANAEWIKLVRPSEYLKVNKPLGIVKIKGGSYDEMMEWTGGSWKNFLLKYPETNQMHKKMLYVSNKIRDLENLGYKNQIKDAKRHLYKGQCNCGYWHGVFGGLYLFHLRKAVYEHLITADKMADAILHKKKKTWLKIKEVDFYLNGKKEILLENEDFSICLDPNEGGVIKELDYRSISFNLVNTLSRRKEQYHQRLLSASQGTNDGSVKTIHDDFRQVEPGLKEKLVYDKFSRHCLRSYFVREDLSREDFAASLFQQLGDFADSSYSFKKKGELIIMEHQCKLKEARFKISKQIQIKQKDKIEIFYAIKRQGHSLSDMIFAVEFNVTMPYLNADRYRYLCDNKNIAGLNTPGTALCASSFGIIDSENELGINLDFQKSPVNIWYLPVETVSQSERAYELNFQCSCIFARWKPEFDKKKNWDLEINWSVII